MSEKLSKCDFCDDPVCLDDFITGECPVEESIEDCGCEVIRDRDTGEVLAVVEYCEYCKAEHEEEAEEWAEIERHMSYLERRF